MSYIQAAQAAENEAFRLRIKAALFEIAQVVAREPHETENHARRVIMASTVTRDPAAYVSQLSWIAAAMPEVQASVTGVAPATVVNAPDALIRAVCLAAWDAVAGIEPPS